MPLATRRSNFHARSPQLSQILWAPLKQLSRQKGWLVAVLLTISGSAASQQCVWNPDRNMHQCPSVPAYVPTIGDWGGGIGNGGENPGGAYGSGWGPGSSFCQAHLASRPPNCGGRPNPADLDDPF